MIVAPRFPGDEHIWVMDIQHDVYMVSIGQMAAEVCRIFCFACVATDGSPELLHRLHRVKLVGVDHRILQDVHDHLAAHYRSVRQNWLHPILPFDSEVSDESRVSEDWKDFWTSAIRVICEDVNLLRACAECIATSGERNNSGKEDNLLKLIHLQFPL